MRGGIGVPERDAEGGYFEEKTRESGFSQADWRRDWLQWRHALSVWLEAYWFERLALHRKFSLAMMKELLVCPPAQTLREEFFSGKEIRCLLVHDHVLLRQGLRRLLDDEADMEVVAEAGDAAEALRKAFEYRPEIVIADAHIFDCAADQIEWLILQESPYSKVLFLTTHEGDALLRAAGGDGANCVVRQTSAEELVEMVRKTHAARKPVVSDVLERRRGELLPQEMLPRKRVLTTREREVLKLLAEGKTVRSAAGVLGLSIKTVDAHKFNLMRKLGIHNKAELVMWAIQKRVVKVPASS